MCNVREILHYKDDFTFRKLYNIFVCQKFCFVEKKCVKAYKIHLFYKHCAERKKTAEKIEQKKEVIGRREINLQRCIATDC